MSFAMAGRSTSRPRHVIQELKCINQSLEIGESRAGCRPQLHVSRERERHHGGVRHKGAGKSEQIFCGVEVTGHGHLLCVEKKLSTGSGDGGSRIAGKRECVTLYRDLKKRRKPPKLRMALRQWGTG
jgi:hypothetical protein